MASVVWHEAKALLAQLDEQSVVQLRNCRLLRTVTPPHEFVREDLFMRNGRVVDARQLFYTEKRMVLQKSQSRLHPTLLCAFRRA